MAARFTKRALLVWIRAGWLCREHIRRRRRKAAGLGSGHADLRAYRRRDTLSCRTHWQALSEPDVYAGLHPRRRDPFDGGRPDAAAGIVRAGIGEAAGQSLGPGE